jgi:hypothetical protein
MYTHTVHGSCTRPSASYSHPSCVSRISPFTYTDCSKSRSTSPNHGEREKSRSEAAIRPRNTRAASLASSSSSRACSSPTTSTAAGHAARSRPVVGLNRRHNSSATPQPSKIRVRIPAFSRISQKSSARSRDSRTARRCSDKRGSSGPEGSRSALACSSRPRNPRPGGL